MSLLNVIVGDVRTRENLYKSEAERGGRSKRCGVVEWTVERAELIEACVVSTSDEFWTTTDQYKIRAKHQLSLQHTLSGCIVQQVRLLTGGEAALVARSVLFLPRNTSNTDN